MHFCPLERIWSCREKGNLLIPPFAISLLSKPSKLWELPVLHESLFFFPNWNGSETKPSTLMSQSLEKLKWLQTHTFHPQREFSGHHESQLPGQDEAESLPWEKQDHQDTVPCPRLSCVQLLTCAHRGEEEEGLFLCLNSSPWWSWGSESCVLQHHK